MNSAITEQTDKTEYNENDWNFVFKRKRNELVKVKCSRGGGH